MLKQKIAWTILLEIAYAIAAVFGDFLINVVLLRHPGSFTPTTTAVITLIVGAPVTYYLIGQHFDLQSGIAERNRLQQELTTALEKTEATARAKSDFLANMTHELRTPLNAIIGFAGLLRQSSALGPQDARRVGLVWDASQTLLTVVNDVLDFSKLEAGAFEFEAQAFDPCVMAQSTVQLLCGQATVKGLTVRTQIDGFEGPLLGDAARLRQVLMNFISNAVKFTAAGEINVSVGQQADGELRRLRIAVTDSGIGVPPDQIDSIFARFTQADASVSRQYGGTGLGLAISKRIIEALGGEIGVISRLDEGSTFWFEISLAVAGTLRDEETGPLGLVAVEQPLRLLVVDDNDVNRELICALLEPFGVLIQTANDGVEAVEAVARSSFDLILMDVQMPNMDGLSATRHIRGAGGHQARRVPIVAMTANVLPEQVARCLAAGMDDHLGKPINPQKLLETLARWSAADADVESAPVHPARPH